MSEMTNTNENKIESKSFIHNFIEEELAVGGRCEGKEVHTRFPPEPNGFLHIGHAKALCINFGIAKQYNGICNLRMDDTNPEKEDTLYVNAIKEDVRWLGFDWGENFFYGSDYFQMQYDLAVGLIEKGLAYVCQLSPEEFKEKRGSIGVPAESPYRDRPIEESLTLFEQMKKGAFPAGAMTLRAKIDLASGNFNMRDPALYRIMHATHHRSGDAWCIYPMYDYAHPLQDAIEGITHSLCSLEFEAHRPLYDWVIEHTGIQAKPRQIEFARLYLNYTVLSKRKLRTLVEENVVEGWDDPRMPTLSGMRRRGYTAQSIRNFCDGIGISKAVSVVDYSYLEHCIREDLNKKAQRVMAVLHPLELRITNYPAGEGAQFTTPNNPEDEAAGTREISFSQKLWIEADDFVEDPPKKYNRLFPGNYVRLKSAGIILCTGCEKDENGNIVRVLAEYHPNLPDGLTPDGKKVRGTIHWVDQNTAEDASIRLYDNLFVDPDPDAADKNFLDCLNPDSLVVLENCKVESYLKTADAGTAFQFMRTGYFCIDEKASASGKLVFNRTVSLKESFKPKAE